ncbi:histidine protein methyltransferase 1 homolog isoform X2 [Ostrinia nubilalis]|uniref:histidine protein methyltransferase 1 homolog isoform X2 n=1 Tax=Ostrinia nubilalis TaxID=29057 RepID=UPI00308234A8
MSLKRMSRRLRKKCVIEKNAFLYHFHVDDEKVEKKEDNIKWQECEEVMPSKQLKDFDEMVKHANMFTCGDIEIGHINVNEAIANMSLENASKLAEEENSDLVTGIYEGGLKIWECTKDMLEYLADNESKIILRDKKVLDLGCGAGILGIYSFLKGSKVTFQDYNREVLEYVTIPNVILNIEEEDAWEQELKKCNFFSGDWSSFNKKLGDDDKFDIILTSETIYNEDNYEKLTNLFIKRLKEDGVVYVAAKTCYFGVGGGIRQFESSINSNKSLDCEVCWKNTHGIQREILKITRKL